MHRKVLLCVTALLFTTIAFSQQIRIIDKKTQEGIEYVFVYDLHQQNTAISNRLGYIKTSDFQRDDTLIFQHPSYAKKTIALANIRNHRVELEGSVVNLDQVTVAASKWEQNLSEVPNKIETINAGEIDLANPQTSADLLRSTGKVYVQKSQQGGGSPMIRGFASNSVLLVIDGVRMNNLIYRGGNLQNVITIDPNIIANSEVIFGPGSMIYGSDALGGVMDFHTKNPAFTGDPGAVHGNIKMRNSSANNEVMGHVDFNYEGKNWASLTSFTYSKFDDLEMGSHDMESYRRTEYVERRNGRDVMVDNPNPDVQKYSGYDQLNILQKIRYEPSDNYNFDYSLYYSTSSDIPRYDRLIQRDDNDRLKYAEWYYGPQLFMMNSLRGEISGVSSLFDQAKITLAHQQVEESRHDRKFRDDFLRHRVEKVNTYNAYLDFEKQFNAQTTLFYGLESVVNTLNSTADKENINTGETFPVATRYPDGDNLYQTYAAYGLAKWNVSSKITLQGGARYNVVDVHSTFNNTSFYNLPFDELNLNTGALSGNLGAVYRAGRNWEFHLNTSSGFRAPNVDDMAKVFDSEPGEVIVPNDNLEPEYAYSSDFTVKKYLDGNGVIEATAFYTYLDNAMVRSDFALNGRDSINYDGEMSDVTALVNTGYAHLYGGSFYLKSRIYGNFSVSGQMTVTEGEDNNGNAIRHAAPTFATAALMYDTERFTGEFYLRYNARISHNNLAPSERSKLHMYALNDAGNPYSPEWYTLNFKASYKISESLKINAGVENILDVRYRPYSSGIAAPGRNFKLALQGNF
ncbi:MAG: TonB-dependent receptor [Bacteroidales bacterium]|nr:TonB-dependent receptor [Bacteroidales bacterium]MCF8337794.1 TonB-dependent receptor [Bacteroidales bacterium]